MFALVRLKVAQVLPLLSLQRCFAWQYLSESPVDAVNSLREDANKLLIFCRGYREGDGSQSVPDVMIHFGNHLHPCHCEPVALPRNLRQSGGQAGYYESREAFSQQSFPAASKI